MSDPALFPEPGRFDPLRFYKQRQQDSVLGKDHVSSGARMSQFVTSDKASLVFGFGRHACPGRFLAADELKMILIYILQHYDIRLEKGETQRYNNLEFAAFVSSLSHPEPESIGRDRLSIHRASQILPRPCDSRGSRVRNRHYRACIGQCISVRPVEYQLFQCGE